MLALVAAILFLIALIFIVAGISLGNLTATAFLVAGLLCLALYHAGVGPNTRFSRR